MIPKEMHPALMGVVPATLITSSKAGIPNITNIARVWYVDSSHVADANHMLNKSIQNLQENSYAFIRTIDPATFSTWELEVTYLGSREDGEVFKEMKKQYEVLSMMIEKDMAITVRCAEIFKVVSARICEEENSQLLFISDFYNSLLAQLEVKFGWDFSAVWILEDFSNQMELTSLRGFKEEAATKVLKRVAQWSLEQGKPVRIINIRSQYQYALTTSLQKQQVKEIFSFKDFQSLDQNYLAIPIKREDGKIIAVLCTQNNNALKFSFFSEEVLNIASRCLSQLNERLAVPTDLTELEQIIEQELERFRLEGSKRAGIFNTTLSPRESQVAVQVARGLSNEEIAKTLFLSKRTVTTHLERIYQKLAINSRVALASYVIENDLSDK